MIVKPNNRIPIISWGYYNISLTPSIEFVDKNNQSTVINTGRVSNTFAEFVLPPEFVTEANLPATINCKVGNETVKVVYIELAPSAGGSGGGIDGTPAWFGNAPSDHFDFNAQRYAKFRVLDDGPRCPARPDLIDITSGDNSKLTVKKSGIYSINITADFLISDKIIGDPLGSGASASASCMLGIGVNGENEPPAWNVYPHNRTQIPDFSALGQNPMNVKITSHGFSLVQPLEVNDYIEVVGAVYISDYTLSNNDFSNWAWIFNNLYVSFARIGNW